jgi:hypothetical protein
MKKATVVLSFILTCGLAQEAFAAIKYERFPHCPDGLVSMKTCECHAGTSGRYHFCHAGHFCHADGTCSQ